MIAACIVPLGIALSHPRPTAMGDLSISHGIVPDQMKIARVVPLFKADDQSLFTNYRPVLVLPSFSKFPGENHLLNRLLDYLTNLYYSL